MRNEIDGDDLPWAIRHEVWGEGTNWLCGKGFGPLISVAPTHVSCNVYIYLRPPIITQNQFRCSRMSRMSCSGRVMVSVNDTLTERVVLWNVDSFMVKNQSIFLPPTVNSSFSPFLHGFLNAARNADIVQNRVALG